MIELHLENTETLELTKKIYELSERMKSAPPHLWWQMSTLLRAYQAEFVSRQQVDQSKSK